MALLQGSRFVQGRCVCQLYLGNSVLSCFPQDPVRDIFIPGHVVVIDIISSAKKGRKLQADHPTLTVVL